MDAIEVKELTKTYGDIVAVNKISFKVKEGSFFAFLGPNGAGKSTTISIICSFLNSDSGSVLIFGKPPSESRKEIGVVFQENILDDKLTVRENIEVRGSMYGFTGDDLKEKVEDALNKSEALEFADQYYGQLSGGQKRRADIARALVHNPKILILDEPTAGLDPQNRKHIWNKIFELKNKGMTVFLTTHYMEEASDADQITIINKGNIVVSGTPATIKEEYCSDYMSIIPKNFDTVINILNDNQIKHSIKVDTVHIPLKNTTDSIPIIEKIKDEIVSIEIRTGTLDDAFIAITGEKIE